jgi:hypothetical protein
MNRITTSPNFLAIFLTVSILIPPISLLSFNTQVGQSVTLSDIPGFTISGQVVSKADGQNSASRGGKIGQSPGRKIDIYQTDWCKQFNKILGTHYKPEARR